MRINHNTAALNAHRQIGINMTSMNRNMERLSSGHRINRASDDAAGLSISEKMRAQIRGLNQAQRNVQDGISLVQTAEGAMGEVSDMLTRMKELAVQATNGTNTSDLASIDKEFQSLKSAISDIASKTKFNGTSLLNSNGTIDIQTGDSSGDKVTINLQDISGLTLGAVDTAANATTALGQIDTAISTVNTARSSFGAIQNQLDHVYNNLGTTSENLVAAESRIRDVDMAKEMMEFAKNNILAQAAQAMLAQANQQPQAVLQLLRA